LVTDENYNLLAYSHSIFDSGGITSTSF